MRLTKETSYRKKDGKFRKTSTNCNKTGVMSSDSSVFNDFSSDEEGNDLLITRKATLKPTDFQDKYGDEADDDERPFEIKSSGKTITDAIEPGQEELDTVESFERVNLTEEQIESEKLRRLRKLKSEKKSKHKTGVVYLSKIPPYMKPSKLRQLLTRFGEVDRLFLKREEEHKYKQRVKGGGNKKIMFEEGWAEFIRKKDAKLCASTLNGNIIGGKKGNFYHDDVMNVKYLSGFKWADLTEQIARENDIRQAKLQLEISQANKLNAEFIRNVEKSKMVKNIKQSRKRSGKGDLDNDNQDSHRNFKQRKVASNRADAPKSQKEYKQPSQALNNVMHSLF